MGVEQKPGENSLQHYFHGALRFITGLGQNSRNPAVSADSVTGVTTLIEEGADEVTPTPTQRIRKRRPRITADYNLPAAYARMAARRLESKAAASNGPIGLRDLPEDITGDIEGQFEKDPEVEEVIEAAEQTGDLATESNPSDLLTIEQLGRRGRNAIAEMAAFLSRPDFSFSGEPTGDEYQEASRLHDLLKGRISLGDAVKAVRARKVLAELQKNDVA